ncbi:unnamed protein product, partial [Mesorhabditis belari]|uniref:Uncharacterized protein n=1 Tax=Mesorhabditis belari TaxID=2138241 RepID=A0AAF3E8L5_9BILA
MNCWLFISCLTIVLYERGEAICPAQCLCADNDIVCSCENTINSKLGLVSLGNAFVRSLTVHSCAQVSIANDSFNGVVIADRLSLISIGRLLIEPQAFRGIAQAPQRLVIDRCHLPLLMTSTFSGLSHFEHLWFRNSSIGIVHEGAFEGVSDVGYVYFRDVRFDQLNSRAFSGITEIKHFYLRGNVEVKSGEHEIFHGSTIDEIVFDELTGKFDEGFLAGVIQKDYTKIYIPRFRELPIPKKIFISIEKTKIETIEPSAFSQMQFSNLTMIDTTISSIEKEAFSEIQADHIKFLNAHIGSISDSAFFAAKIEHLEFTKSSVAVWQKRSMNNCSVSTWLVHDTSFENIEEKAWIHAKFKNLEILHSHIGKIRPKVLRNSQVKSLTIRNSEIGSPLEETLLADVTPTRVQIVHNKLTCNTEACEANSLQLHPSIHPLLWKFEYNSCRGKTVNICVNPSTVYHQGLVCRSHWRLLECICGDSSSVTLPEMTNATILVLGDCEEVTLRSDVKSLRALYLYRMKRISIEELPSNIDTIEIFHSKVILTPRALLSRKVSLLSISNSKLESLPKDSITNSTIFEFNLENSYVKGIENGALASSSIEKLRINGSSIEGIGSSVLGQIDELVLSDSLLGSTPDLTQIPNIHLHNNTILCCCDFDAKCSFGAHRQICDQRFPQMCLENGSLFTITNFVLILSVYRFLFSE